MEIKFDFYTLHARLLPGLIVFLPIGLVIFALFSNEEITTGSILGISIPCIISVLLSHLSRDQGKKKEPNLFKKWGGKPTTQLLRHENDILSPVMKARYHKLLETLLNISLPTIEEERNDPKASDDVYETCVNFLREKTRNTQEFHLIFSENTNYGFRRNLWGMKPVGICLAIIGLLISIYLLYRNAYNFNSLSAVTLNLSLLVIWVFCITPEWVKVPAFSYAEKLLASCEIL